MSEFLLRPAVKEDAVAIIEAHDAAIREKAFSQYSQDIIDTWAPAAITPDRIEKVEKQIASDNWLVIVAEAKKQILGYGAVSFVKNQLGAVYVRRNPYGRIGKQIMDYLLQKARENKCAFLEMDSSVNAEAFYRSVGFKTLSLGSHSMGQTGKEMSCIKMRIDLT